MGSVIDLTGKTFGKWTVLGRDKAAEKPGVFWRCRCECGKRASIIAGSLRSGNSTSCGCARTDALHASIVGKRFGQLTVIEPTKARSGGGAIVYRCLCDCGRSHMVRGAILRNGQVSSCGCQRLAGLAAARDSAPSDLTGRRFGHLRVTGFALTRKGSRHWDCVCDCGSEVLVRGKDLVHGNTKSCGCLVYRLPELYESGADA